MANKMLIDSSHPEETRVVVLRGNRVEDFDFESASKKPLRGNIYLAKVTRVEPSLQAAFIEYGGNRHGFLAFSEIHPDYYQIPVADRQALLEEEARAHREEDDDHRPSGNGQGHGRRSRRHRGRERQSSEKRADLGDETLAESIEGSDPQSDEIVEAIGSVAVEADGEGAVPLDERPPEAAAAEIETADRSPAGETDDAEQAEPAMEQADLTVGSPVEEIAAPFVDPERSDDPADDFETVATASDPGVDEFDPGVAEVRADDVTERDGTLPAGENGRTDEAAVADEAVAEEEEEHVEQIGGDALEDATYRAPRLRRHYKIQEVIKRRQILLVQVVKEERGNKGAALTTYLSLAGRYSVLMPNTARGGGISRKITDSDDRKRLKAIAGELDVPEGMGVILRTAGAARGEQEVKRDFEYLLRMWETVRETTLASSAPKLVYEEGSLIKRTIRDLYSKEIDEIWVSGDGGYREARDYMRLLMPSHVKNVHLYDDPQPIFAKGGAEAQLDAMFSNHVTLKSGGYIVINQTEALVAIDVNSGRSTREHNIEDTALRTNLEAADEVARQLRLRDLAGLIVVDFIDMEEGRNNRSVERRIKDALKNDRARIQIGRISHFGLLEMSRQRIRTGVLEGSTVICPHCAGAGTVRSTSSIALHVLRVLEDTLIRSASHNLIVRTRTEVALYILNQKRANLTSLEHRFGVQIVVMADGTLTGTVYHTLERGEPATPPAALLGQVSPEDREDEEHVEDDVEDVDDSADVVAEDAQESRVGEDAAGSGDRRRRRRRRRRGRDREPGATDTQASPESVDEDDLVSAPAGQIVADETGDDGQDRMIETPEPVLDGDAAEATDDGEDAEEASEEPTAPRRRRRSRRTAGRATASDGDETAEVTEPSAGEDVVTTPRRSRRSRSRSQDEQTASQLSFATPSADRDVGADTAVNHPADVVPAANAESTEPESLPDLALSVADPEGSAPGADEPVTADEPPRPKRSGWWQRAKATLTGE